MKWDQRFFSSFDIGGGATSMTSGFQLTSCPSGLARGVESHHVGAELHVVAPPDALDVALQLHSERTVVPAGARAAIDLARLKNKPAPLAQRHDRVHVYH